MKPPGISLKGRYNIAGAMLFEASLDLPAGKWTCLLGPSGAGKSTILRLILGLETAGELIGDIHADDGQPLSERVSYMAQSDLLLPWLSVTENVMIGAKLRGETPDTERANKLLDRVGLGEHAYKTPAKLSGGMRQRAALARTLMEDRPVILLDEPFSALDAGTRADMQELSAEVLEGKTVLLVTHEPAEASRLAHKIAIMSDKEIIDWPVPKSKPIRKIDAKETLECQARMLTHIRQVQS